MSDVSIGSTLRAILAAAPGHATALIAPETDTRWSYEDLRAQVDRLAGQLASVGIGRGDRVAIVLPNGPEIVATFLAVVHGGAVAAPLNPAYKADEFSFYFGDIQPRVLVVPPGEAAAARETAPAGCRVLEIAAGANGLLTFAGAGDPAPVEVPTPDDIALVLHTSGTTSRPKQVPLRHRNLLASARNIVETYRLTSDDVSLCVMPLFHVHGLLASTLSTLLAGGAVVAPTRFSASRFWADALTYGATWYSAVPTIHQIILARCDDEGVPAPGQTGLRFARSCSSALAPATMQALEQRFGMPVLEAYGMTEASHQMASNPLPPAARLPGSVGRATGIQIGIMDGMGTLLPADTPGEVVIKGASVTDGYLNNPEANKSAFTDGWFRTGDQGTLDANGYLRLTGRLKEMILRGGENIAPREIDEVLLTHPAVAEAITFGVADEKYGEEVAAAVVLRAEATPEQIMAHCREHIAEFKVPKTIYITETIPRTATGKIQRRIVAQAFATA